MRRTTVLEEEEKYAQKLAFMAANRAQRAAAIHDPSVKIESVDTKLCQMQIQERMSRKQAEREADRLAVEEERRIAKVIAAAELDHRMREKKEQQQLKTCWALQSDQRMRREADLNPRVTRDAPIDADSCAMSACQQFAGEDRRRIERRRLQNRQMYHYAKQQSEMKKARETIEKENDRRYIQTLVDLDTQGAVWDEEAELEAKKANRDMKMANDFIIKSKKDELRAAHARNQRNNNREVEYQMSSKFLNDISDGTKMNYKGMSKEERLNILEDNQRVIEEKARLKSQAANEDRLWALQTTRINRTILAGEAEDQARREKSARDLQEAQKWQMVEAQRTRAEAKRNARGSIQGGWFSQFGTSHR